MPIYSNASINHTTQNASLDVKHKSGHECDIVQVQYSEDMTKMWVNIGGECIFRLNTDTEIHIEKT